MIDLIIVIILLMMIGAAIVYIVKAKKRGVKCIGCPAAGTCSGQQSQACSCGSYADTKKKS